MSDYTIHRLYENEFELLIPLMKDCFGVGFKLDYFQWKFVANPAGFVFGFYAKHKSGEISAYYGVIPELFEINQETKIVFQSCDTMTHSNHRRKGLFQLLALHCFEKLKESNLSFIYGFGGGMSTPGFLKFGWIELFKINYFFYPRQFNILNLSKQNSNVIEITKIEQIEHLIYASTKNSTIHSIKNKQTYSWRISNPLYNYKIIALKNNDYINSYLVFYEMKDKIFVFDFYSENGKNLKFLFNYLKNNLKKNQKGIISFVQDNSFWSHQLKLNGFIHNPLKIGPLNEKIPFIIYDPLKNLENYYSYKNWSVNPFDHDAL
jgi:hypothetical protein